MSIEVRDHVSIAVKLKSFDVAAPSGFAILPHNLATATSKVDLRQHVESDTVRTLLLANNIPTSKYLMRMISHPICNNTALSGLGRLCLYPQV